MDATLLVLAAGMGSRFGGLKQIDRFGPSGETIIDYSVYDAIESGFKKVVFVIRHEFEEEFKKVISDKYIGKIEVEFAYQELDNLPEGINSFPDRIKPWGTGHAVWVAKSKLVTPFAVINADDYYGRESFQIIADYLGNLVIDDLSKQCMVGYTLNNTLSENGDVSRGVCEIDSSFNLEEIVERTEIIKKGERAAFIEEGIEYPLSGKEVVSMNMMGFTPVALEKFESDFKLFMKERGHELKSEFYLPTVLSNLVKSGESTVKVLTTSSKWFGVTYKEDKPLVMEKINKLVEAEVYPQQLWPN
ncbi:MAG: sugar phosphate nucleotidyltransferase [Bacteroidota bacterium]